MKKACAAVVFMFILYNLPAQDFSRIIQLQNKRMNGQDVTALQQRLLALGFKKTGPADGWYGPLTEGSVRTAQYFLGFPQDGRVSRPFWTVLFNAKQDALLKGIGVISTYDPKAFTVTSRRNGSSNDFDDFLVSSIKNEVKNVRFQHINEGLPIFRFTVFYLPSAVFIVQDVYYGDYKTRIFLKDTRGIFELKNGETAEADPALEGILNRVRDGITAAGLTAPVLTAQANPAPAVPAQSAAPAAAPKPAAPTDAKTPAPAAPALKASAEPAEKTAPEKTAPAPEKPEQAKTGETSADKPLTVPAAKP